MTDPPDTDPSRIVAYFFRQRYESDREENGPRTLEDYQDMYPGYEDVVAGEFELLQAVASDEAGPSTPAKPRDVFAGRYEIVGEIGRGGQGVVYLARDSRLSREVALKVFDSLTMPVHGLRRFQREAEITAALDHPGIASVLDTGFHENTAYIAMRYVKGESLSRIIQATLATVRSPDESSAIALSKQTSEHAARRPPEPSTRRQVVMEAVRLIESVARSLHAAHEAGVVHRDINPRNIIVTPSRKPVILDFGLARSEESDDHSLTHTGDLFGTPAYMSPEQLRLEPHKLDRRTDVYSLGVILYECMTLHRPFVAPTREALYQSIQLVDPPNPRNYNPHISEDLRVVIETALEKDLDRRYQSADALAEDLRRVRELEPIHARPAGARVKLQRWAQRNRGLASSLTAAGFFLIAGLAVSLLMWGRAENSALQASLDRDETAATLARYEQMSDAHIANELLAKERELWPRRSHLVPDMQGWLSEARDLYARRGLHEAALAELDVQIAAAVPIDAAWRREVASDAWRHSVLTDLMEQLDRLPPLIDKLADRLAFAESIEQVSIEQEREAWDLCLEDVRTDPRYGFALSPQVGLIPLGKDRDSKLWEFWHVGTGTRPRWEGEVLAGNVDCEDDSGMVLVLLPGGEFRIGAQPNDPDAENYDPIASGNELPTHLVTLRPFFISKYETTQAQWEAIEDSNPSLYKPGHVSSRRLTITPRNPVENVDWVVSTAYLAKVGMVLPSEAQWEYACRAGTSTPFYTGADTDSLVGHANLADEASAPYFPENWIFVEGFVDDHDLHAPVGSYLPNPFGLYDMHGNMIEWCRDDYVDYRDIPDDIQRDADGFTHNAEFLLIQRGGNWNTIGERTRSSSRRRGPATLSFEVTGFRAVKLIDPESTEQSR